MQRWITSTLNSEFHMSAIDSEFSTEDSEKYACIFDPLNANNKTYIIN